MSPIVSTLAGASARGYGGLGASVSSAVAGTYESISTVTVGSGGTSYIEFTTIGSGYKHLQLRYIAMFTIANAEFEISYNADTTHGNYARHGLLGDGSSASANAATGANTRSILYTRNSSSDSAGVSIIDILDYGSTSKYKTLRAITGQDYNGSGTVALISGLWMNNTNAITSIKLQPTAGSIRQFSQFALYGIKGA